jgi:transcriptional regulator with XRE-family HTH domain
MPERPMHPSRTALGAALRSARLAARLTLRQAEAAASVSRGALSPWERGDTCPRVDVLVRLARAYRADAAELFKAALPCA